MEKKQVGETERENEKKAPHTKHKRMKIFFLKRSRRMDKNKNTATATESGYPTQ